MKVVPFFPLILNALEESKDAFRRNWVAAIPCHLGRRNSLIGAMPLCLKNNSQGELSLITAGQMHTTNIKNIIIQSLSHDSIHACNWSKNSIFHIE